jgi:copper chaperone
MIAMNRFAFESLFHLPTLVCECCVDAVAASLRTVDDAVRIEADLAARTVRVLSRHYEATILRALREAGHQAEPVLAPLG